MLRVKAFFIVFCLLLSNPAFAYLDPGTGSMIMYFIIAIFSTCLYFIRELFYKIKLFFSIGKVDTSLRKPEDSDILFYSEGAQYWRCFLPIIEELEKLEIKSAYYTSDVNDEGLKFEGKYFVTQHIGSEYSTFVMLNHLDVKVVVMTTPQLDILQLKRSALVKHYVHLVHAPTDILLYKKFAVDYFDSVMCSGQHQIESIRLLEEKRGLPRKKLFETGLTYYDIMCRDKPKGLRKEGTTVLVAPTWGVNGMLSKFGSKPIEILLYANYNVIFRPHPQLYTSQRELIESMEEKFRGVENLEIDRAPSGELSMERADIMLSDISGIIFDFLFVYEKQVVLIGGNDVQLGGVEAEDVEKEVWECQMFNQIATLIPPERMHEIALIIGETLANTEKCDISRFRQESIFNFGHSGKIAAKQLVDILRDI